MWRTGCCPSSCPTQTPTGATGYGCCLPLGLHRILNRADIRPTFLPYIRLNSYIRICINIYFLLWYMFFLILFVFCFNLKQSFLAGYPPGYRLSKKDGYPVQPYIFTMYPAQQEGTESKCLDVKVYRLRSSLCIMLFEATLAATGSKSSVYWILRQQVSPILTDIIGVCIILTRNKISKEKEREKAG